MVCFPGKVPEGVVDEDHLVSGLDFFPTLCDYAEIDPPEKMRGLSLRPLLEGKETNWRRYLLAQSRASGRMILDERYKFIRYNGSPTTQLFDMVDDPHEIKNLAPEAKFATTCQRLADEIDRVEGTLDNADIPDNLLNPKHPRKGRQAP